MADGSEAVATLQDWIDRLHELADLPEALAPRAAKLLEKQVAANIAAGKGPDGTAWQPTKEGAKPLRNAARALRSTSDGTVAILILEGPEVLHHQGRAKGGIARPILPSRKLPGAAIKALQQLYAEACGKVLSGS
jgi:hypothetical protein